MTEVRKIKTGRSIGLLILLCTWQLQMIAAKRITGPEVDVILGNGKDPAAAEGEVRLVSRQQRDSATSGALQVFCDGAWGAVCNANFGNNDALVACRQLGFTTGVPIGRVLADDTPDAEVLAPFALANPGCAGNETRLVDCPVQMSTQDDRGDINTAVCDPFFDTFAFVECRDAARNGSNTAEDGSVRLTGGATAEDGSAEYGRLEVFFRGGWGRVCRTGEDTSSVSRGSVAVVCGLLGYDQGMHITAVRLVPSAEPRVPTHAQNLQCRGNESRLLDCPELGLGDAYEGIQDCPTCFCGDIVLSCFSNSSSGMDGRLRLVAGRGSVSEGFAFGRLEVFLRGFWSNICSDVQTPFPPESAKVACRGLGYDGGEPLLFGLPYSSGLDSPFLVDASLPLAYGGVRCNGDERSLGRCPRAARPANECRFNLASSTVLACANTVGPSGCSEAEASVEGAVRLRGGFGTLCDPLYSGFVEILQNGTWGGLCLLRERQNPENTLVADVVCRQLGFPHGTRVLPRIAGAAGNAATLFSVDNAECRGPEAALADCDLGTGVQPVDNGNASVSDSGDSDYDYDDGSNCNVRRQLYVACRQVPVAEVVETGTDAADGDLRLVDRRNVSNWVVGELEMFFEGSWGDVCETVFDAADADVACRQLGLGAGTVGSPASAVNVEQEDPELEDAAVTSVAGVSLTVPGCLGDEATLLECGADANASRFEFRLCGVTLACVGDEEEGVEGDVRLFDAKPTEVAGAVSGFLEVFHAGAWGTLCTGAVSEGYYYYSPESVEALFDDDFVDVPPVFSTAAPVVACRQLGFETGVFPSSRTARDSGNGTAPPWLSALQCSGDEAAVLDCVTSGLGETWSCGRVPELRCFNSSINGSVPPVPNEEKISAVRLVGGSADPGGAWEYGRLEVLVNGGWLAIDEQTSNENLGRAGAEAACTSLGYTSAVELLAGSSSALPSLTDDLSSRRRISCEGNETSLEECDLDYVGYIYYRYDDGPPSLDVALLCTNPSGCEATAAGAPVEGDVRLQPLVGTGAPTAACDEVHFGAVELFHAGRWGRICGSSDFTNNPDDDTGIDAQVVCRQLGFPFGGSADADEDFVYNFDYDDGSVGNGALVWATEVVCTGKEERLLDCDFPESFGGTSGGEDAGIGPDASCSSDASAILSVVCRRFELTESAVIR